MEINISTQRIDFISIFYAKDFINYHPNKVPNINSIFKYHYIPVDNSDALELFSRLIFTISYEDYRRVHDYLLSGGFNSYHINLITYFQIIKN